MLLNKAINLFLCVLFLVFSNQVKAQNWVNTYGNSSLENLSQVVESEEGTIYISGTFQNTIDFEGQTLIAADKADIAIVRLAENGTVEWAKGFGSVDEDKVGGMALMNDLYIAGIYWDSIQFDNFSLINNSSAVYVSRLDTSGQVAWAVSFGGIGFKTVNDLVVDQQGYFYITGTFDGTLQGNNFSLTANGARDFFLCKMDTIGNVIWMKQAGNTGFSEGHGLAYYNNELIVGGQLTGNLTLGATTINANTNDYDGFISKWDTAGNVIWAQKIGGNNDDFLRDVAMDTDGNIYVTGSFVNVLFFPNNQQITTLLFDTDVFLAKYNLSGTFLWAKGLGGGENDVGVSLDVKTDKLLLGGYFDETTNLDGISFSTDPFDFDSFIAEFDTSGTIQHAAVLQGIGVCFLAKAIYSRDETPIFIGNYENNLVVNGFNLNALGSFDMVVGRYGFPLFNQEIINNDKITIYPNPAQSVIYIEFEDFNAATIQLIDNLGRVLTQKETIENKVAIDLNAYPKGIYYLHIKTKNAIITKKLMLSGS